MDERIERINTAVSYIRSVVGDFQPLVGIILGSGLGRLAESIEEKTVIPYAEIPCFPCSTAMGHAGNLIFGKLGGRRVVAMQGRIHYYEGKPMDVVTMPTRVMTKLGIKYIFLSNAAGGLNKTFNVGDLMVIRDHINTFPNPLIGPNMDEFGERFPDMTRPYDTEIIAKAHALAAEAGYRLQEGVYMGVTGPTYETPAEVRYYRMIGGDAVGMSTIPEAIVARHAGVRVFGVSVITNKANDSYESAVLNDGEDVIKAANAAGDRLSDLFSNIISGL